MKTYSKKVIRVKIYDFLISGRKFSFFYDYDGNGRYFEI